jgi:8-oxo-dGTP pyrophosphatase MutT (NUDIX family)
MSAPDLPYLPVTLNGHRFGCVSLARAQWLLEQDFEGLREAVQGLRLVFPDVSAGLREINLVCAHHGALRGWRHEAVDVLNWSGSFCLGQMERAAARFWGSHTRAAHLNAWVRCDDGHGFDLWLARRSGHKATDPGLWDNLVAGGLGPQESPLTGLRREAREEAGLNISLALQLSYGPTLKISRPVPEGWQRESLFCVDAQLPMDFCPINRDGEVQAFEQLDRPAAIQRAQSGLMTADAALVTLDFLNRHH